MFLGLNGRVAVVTGASRGIGRAIVDGLIDEGALVVAGARDVSSLTGSNIHAVAGDLSTADGPRRLIEAAVERHGGIDFLVNNVGGGRLQLDGITAATDEDWQWSFDINLLSHVRAIRAALPHLIESRGVIVNVSSLNGRAPAVDAPEYSAMKAALNSVSRALAVELAPKGVRVNVVSPGPVLTDMQTGAGGVAEQLAAAGHGSADDYVASVEREVPLGRFAQPHEVANVVLALLSYRFGYVTGADVPIDGATA